MVNLQWNLNGCCDTDVVLFLVFYSVYFVLIYWFWNYQFLKPLKLFAVFVHEMSHASAAWLTCGKVKAVEVYGSEAGIVGYSGGIKAIVIPAGYVGGAFWGGAFVALSGGRIGATVAACIVSAALILALAHNPNKVVVYIAVGFSLITGTFIILEWFVFSPILQYFTLFYGVFFGYYACRDIWDDTVSRDTEDSDAIVCSRTYPICSPPKCVGVQFLIVALIFQVVGLYAALVWLVSK